MDSRCIIELAESQFRLSDDERGFLETVLTYQDIPTLVSDEAGTDSIITSVPQQQLSAQLLIWLCTDADVAARVPPWGIRVFNAQIEGSLNLQFAKLEFPLILRQCFFTETIRLECASLPSLDLSGSQLRGSQIIDLYGAVTTVALAATNLQVEHDVILMNGFKANGAVTLTGAKIGVQIACSGGTFCNPNGIAFNAQGAEIGESIYLMNGFEAEGFFWLGGVKIGGHLYCNGGKFRNPSLTALNIHGSDIGGSVYLMDGFEAEGEVNLSGVKIGGRLSCNGGKFHNPTGIALDVQGAEIGEGLFLSDGFKAQGEVDFSFVTTRVLDDREEDWPNKLHLNGFTYEKLAPLAPVQGKKRLNWLQLQPQQPFSPQSYEQLAAVLKASGYDEAATEILIGQQDDRIKHAVMNPIQKEVNRFLGVFIAYGYRSYRALFWALGLILVGAGLFQWGYSHPSQLITPSDIGNASTAPSQVSGDYPAFNALIYSTDVFLPIIDLYQQSYWIPNANRGAEVSLLMLKCRQGALLRWYFWMHIIFGWILTSLWVAGFTGLVRKLE